MGCSFSTDKDAWDIQLEERTDEVTRLIGRYSPSHPQKVNIAGLVELDCTVEVDNAIIEIKTGGHRVGVFGRDNTIKVTGCQLQLRVDGEGNTLTGTGEGTVLYVDEAIEVKDIVIAEKKSSFACDAPKKLPLMEEDGDTSCLPDDEGERIRITYKAKDCGGGDGDVPSLTDSIPPDRSPSDQGKTGVKRDAEDSDGADENDPERKRARAD